jgi:hypothetical protein
MAQPLTKGEIERRLFNAEQALAAAQRGQDAKTIRSCRARVDYYKRCLTMGAARRSAASEKANRTMRCIVSALLLAVSLAGAMSPAIAAPPEQGRPYSCRLYDDAQRQCGFGSCDQRLLAQPGDQPHAHRG